MEDLEQSGSQVMNPLPTVIVCGNGHQDAGQFRAQIAAALNQAGVDCTILEGLPVAPMPAPAQMGVRLPRPPEPARPQFSVVLPIYNEEANLPELYRRLSAVLDEMGEPYELVFVDDGSRDRTVELLRTLHARDARVRVIRLTRNFGHQRAISAGLDYARGQAVIVMDADLQDPPEVIPLFVEKWREDFQVVYAVREKRKESVLKRMAYHSFYHALRAISRIDIPLETGDFCLMDRRVVEAIIALPERNRFVRGLRSWVGYRQVGLAYERDARFAGEPKYTFRKLASLALDGLVSFSYMPLRLATLSGFAVSAFSLLAAVYYLIKRLTVGLQPPGFATLVILITFLGGVQLITIGVVGEYIGHVLDEAKGRPAYMVREVMDHAPGSRAGAETDMEGGNAESTHSDLGQ